jgi:hypothetical protein
MAQNNVIFAESVTPLGASATFTGASRYCGQPAGGAAAYAAFNAFAFADVAGTLRIEASNDQITWRRATADQAVGASAALILSIPVFAAFYRAVYINGAGAQAAFMLNTSFTAA